MGCLSGKTQLKTFLGITVKSQPFIEQMGSLPRHSAHQNDFITVSFFCVFDGGFHCHPAVSHLSAVRMSYHIFYHGKRSLFPCQIGDDGDQAGRCRFCTVVGYKAGDLTVVYNLRPDFCKRLRSRVIFFRKQLLVEGQ